MDNRLKQELAYRDASGWQRLSVAAMDLRFRELGYRLDRSLDCRGSAQYVTGKRAGESYPVVTCGITDLATGKSAFHEKGARGNRFHLMQELRGRVYAVAAGAILET